MTRFNFLRRARLNTVLLTSGLLLLAGCVTSESAFKKGDFAEAARMSAERLARFPKSKKATEIFLKAYPQAREVWLRKVDLTLDSEDPFRWERSIAMYEVLQGLSTRAALTPFAQTDEVPIVYYNQQLEDVRAQAAENRIILAAEDMASGDMYRAREAYGHYSMALSFVGNREDILRKQEEARRDGTLTVGVEPVISFGHGVNPHHLTSELNGELESSRSSPFVAFRALSGQSSAGVENIVQLEVGELSVRRSERELRQKWVNRTLDREESDLQVEAKLMKREKLITVSSPATVRVYEARGGTLLFEKPLNSRYRWKETWDVVEGDTRAVVGRKLRLAEPPDPEYAHLAEKISRTIAVEAREAINSYYARF